MKPLWRHKVWLLIFVGIVSVAGYVYKTKNNTSANDNASLGTVTRSDLVQRVTFSGGIIAERTTMLQAPYDGYVQKVYVKVGDAVTSGQPIIAMSPTANTDKEAEVFPLRAPFDGVVTQVQKSAGQYVSKNYSESNDSSLVRIDDLSHLMVKADVPEIDYPKLKAGQNVIIRATSIQDKTYNGVIRSVARASKQTVRWERNKVEFEVIVAINDADARLAPGMSALIDVITFESKNILVIRHEYLQRDKEQYFVIQDDGTRKELKVGIQNDEFFEIKSGIAEGTKLKPTDFSKM